VRKLYVEKGDTLREKVLVCVLTDDAEESWEEPGPVDEASGPAAADAAAAQTTAVSTPSAGGPIKAAPAARKRAKDIGVELATLVGTGPGGRITVEDVESARAPGAASSANDGWTTLSPHRLAIVSQMQAAAREIPQYHVARLMDVGALLEPSEDVTFTHRLIRATGRALANHPALRTLTDGKRVKEMPVSVAVAMDTANGLVAPAIRGADELAIEEIAAQVKDLRLRADAGQLRGDELADAPFAISNLGMLGVDFFNAFVFQGQTAVLAVGTAVDTLSWFSLALDHRVVDGAEAARFLETLQAEIAAS
jgi:pyruvate dehydrogenase E2 component (dihydrolipoamide acetyltransferase)